MDNVDSVDRNEKFRIQASAPTQGLLIFKSGVRRRTNRKLCDGPVRIDPVGHLAEERACRLESFRTVDRPGSSRARCAGRSKLARSGFPNLQAPAADLPDRTPPELFPRA